MGIQYYGFALFVFVLVCLVAVLCKLLFSDVKRQNKLLDEKETKLLKLYQTVEDVLDEYYDEVSEAKAEIKRQAEQKSLQAAIPATVSQNPESPAEPSEPVTQDRVKETDLVTMQTQNTRSKPLRSAARTGPVSFQRIIDEVVDDPVYDPPKTTEPELEQKPSRRDSILRLHAQGKNTAAIAQELGITQNEVNLVIGLSL